MLVFRALPQRINFSSLNHGWYKDVDPTMTIDDLAVMLHEEEGIPVACEFVYRGDPLERGHTIAEYGIGTIPVFCFTDQVRPSPSATLVPLLAARTVADLYTVDCTGSRAGAAFDAPRRCSTVLPRVREPVNGIPVPARDRAHAVWRLGCP